MSKNMTKRKPNKGDRFGEMATTRGWQAESIEKSNHAKNTRAQNKKR